MSDIIDLAIGLPAYGGKISAEHARMFLELGHTLACSERRFRLKHQEFIDVCGIERARNALLAKAMIAQSTWLLMIDADTWVVENSGDSAGVQLLQMISQGDRAGATIVGAPVIRRVTSSKGELNVYRHDAGHIIIKPKFSQSILEPKLNPVKYIEQELVEVDAIGAACVAINLTKLTANILFRFTDLLSEDLEFCRQVKEAGGKIFVDGRVNTAHLSRPYPLLSSEKTYNPDVIK